MLTCPENSRLASSRNTGLLALIFRVDMNQRQAFGVGGCGVACCNLGRAVTESTLGMLRVQRSAEGGIMDEQVGIMSQGMMASVGIVSPVKANA